MCHSYFKAYYILDFIDLDINDDILDGLDAMNFVTCTPIQERAIPIILEGNDLLASAQTGTGKTAAYLLPVIELLSRGEAPDSKVNALILVPTRELALQVDQLLGGFAYYTDTTWIAIYGGNDGVAYAQQHKALMQGGDIAVATPGRLLSMLRTANVDLSHVQYLILDEADRMLDIGFYDDIMEIIGHLPKHRQTLMFSATFPKDVEKLARQVLQEPKEVKIAVSKPAEGITQGVYLLHETQKIPLVAELFRQKAWGKSIIFLSSKEKVREVFRTLKKLNLQVAQMHSDLDQSERSQVMLDFKNNKINILVATDVVSRGIDIDDIELVINYDVPHQAEDYVHRIGRTARAGAKGEAITLVTPQDRFRLDKIERFIERTIPRLVLPEKVATLAAAVEDKPDVKQKNRYGMKRNHGHSNNKTSGKKPYRSKKKNSSAQS